MNNINEQYEAYKYELKMKMLGIGIEECKKIIEEIERENWIHPGQQDIDF